MTRYINPFTDFGFKNLFGREHTKDILIDFLNELYVDLSDMQPIVDLTYGNKEATRTHPQGKTVIYDIRCKTSDNYHFIIEMQVDSQSTFLSRAFYYLCRAVADQGEMGNNWKYDFEPVFGVYITDFKMPTMSEEVKIHSKLCDLNTGKPLFGKLCLSFIQLIYFNKPKEECTTGFDQWIYILKNMSTMQEMPFTTEKEIFKKVQTVSEYRSLNPTQRAEYDDALRRYRDYNCVLSTAREEGLARGREEGLIEGRAEGLEAGMEIGIAKGLEDGANQKSIAIARGMKSRGMDLVTISELTELSIAEIEAL